MFNPKHNIMPNSVKTTLIDGTTLTVSLSSHPDFDYEVYFSNTDDTHYGNFEEGETLKSVAEWYYNQDEQELFY